MIFTFRYTYLFDTPDGIKRIKDEIKVSANNSPESWKKFGEAVRGKTVVEVIDVKVEGPNREFSVTDLLQWLDYERKFNESGYIEYKDVNEETARTFRVKADVYERIYILIDGGRFGGA